MTFAIFAITMGAGVNNPKNWIRIRKNGKKSVVTVLNLDDEIIAKVSWKSFSSDFPIMSFVDCAYTRLNNEYKARVMFENTPDQQMKMIVEYICEDSFEGNKTFDEYAFYDTRGYDGIIIKMAEEA